jgi:hypothetical protein
MWQQEEKRIIVSLFKKKEGKKERANVGVSRCI